MGNDVKTIQEETIYLGLGSNLEDRELNLETALQALPPEVEIIKKSSLYQTEPWGFLDQPDFINQVLEGKTLLSPTDLLSYLKDIENEIGRKPNIRFGPRLVDIDILFYGDHFINDKKLTIPHKRIKERAFMLVPLAEIAPQLQYPGSDETITDLVKKVDCSGVDLFQVYDE